MGAGGRRGWSAGVALVCAAGLVSGCGVVEDTIDGMTGNNEPAEQPATPTDEQTPSEGLVVVVTVESDAPTTGELMIEIDSPRNSQSLREDSVEVPFEHEFTVAADIAFPLRNSRVEVDAGPGATYVECSIAVNENVVSTHRSEGSAATAVCERGLQLGPS